MTRRCSLVKDLRRLINHQKYSDIEIICEDGTKLFGCKAILAARSEVFDRMLYNGMKESYEKQIIFPEIDSLSMAIVIEFLYTGCNVNNPLTNENIVGAYHAADYLQLPDLQEVIIETLKETLNQRFYECIAPELLSRAIDKMTESAENLFLTLLTESVAKIPLNTIDYSRLSFTALQYLLCYTFDKEKHFATPEYEVLRFGIIQAAYQISNDAAISLKSRLPTLNKAGNFLKFDPKLIHNQDIVHRSEIVELVTNLVDFIDFRRIDGKILTDIIDPLEMIPSEIIVSAYRFLISNKKNLPAVRGIPYICDKSGFVWDKQASGPHLSIDKDGAVVKALRGCKLHQNVKAKVEIFDRGIYEWDVIIEKSCTFAWVGICSPENFRYEGFIGVQANGWVFGSNGQCYSNNNCITYGTTFGEGDVITVHLDMDNRTCAFSINGKKYPTVSTWTNLPSKVYPMASLRYPGRFRIRFHDL
ncbi:19410_t:CDS:1 [Funneliformis geosporum]|nr:19410_t:CDS:1 [Funneliformis geosporum]